MTTMNAPSIRSLRSNLLGASFLTVTVALAGAARAADDGFAAFWKVFAPAMAKDDRSALAGMVGPILGPFSTFHAQYLKGSARTRRSACSTVC
jgi:hypothetical protein